MKTLLSAAVALALLAGTGAALAQAAAPASGAGTSNSNNTGIADRDGRVKARDTMMKDRGMMVRVYDRAGKVYYDGQPRYMRRSTGGVGVYFPAFSAPVDEMFFDAPDHIERSGS